MKTLYTVIKNFIRKIVYRQFADSDSAIKYYRNKGITIGDNCKIFGPRTVEIDITKPSLITIGSNVQITSGVKIISHGFDWYVLNGVYGDILGSAGKIKIGNNVFIGMNSIILKGVVIGNNVIIGAGSIVTKSIPDNTVVAGNPAKVLYPLEEYYMKRVSVQRDEALALYESFIERYGYRPSKDYFHEFFWLFEMLDTNNQFNEPKFNYEMHIGGEKRYTKTLTKYENTQRIFTSYENFCDWCDKSIALRKNS